MKSPEKIMINIFPSGQYRTDREAYLHEAHQIALAFQHRVWAWFDSRQRISINPNFPCRCRACTEMRRIGCIDVVAAQEDNTLPDNTLPNT